MTNQKGRKIVNLNRLRIWAWFSDSPPKFSICFQGKLRPTCLVNEMNCSCIFFRGCLQWSEIILLVNHKFLVFLEICHLKFLYFGDFCSSIPSKVTCQKWVKVIMQCFLYFFRVLSIENVTKLSTETESHFGRVNFKNHSYKWNSMEVSTWSL